MAEIQAQHIQLHHQRLAQNQQAQLQMQLQLQHQKEHAKQIQALEDGQREIKHQQWLLWTSIRELKQQLHEQSTSDKQIHKQQEQLLEQLEQIREELGWQRRVTDLEIARKEARKEKETRRPDRSRSRRRRRSDPEGGA